MVLLARLLDTNISQLFRLCKHFQQKDSNKCLFILILNKKTPLLTGKKCPYTRLENDFSVKRYVKWSDSLWLVLITEGATPTLQTCEQLRATSDRPTDRTAERPCLLWFLFNIMDIIEHRLPGRTNAHHVRPSVRVAWCHYVQPTRPPKSQKFRPNFWKWQPPGRFSNRFPFRVDRAEWGYYPKSPTI